MANSKDEPPAPRTGGGVAATSGLIFVSDASAEAERLTVALRSRGYPTVDVPLGLLAARIGVQEPALILCDADASGVLELIEGVVPGRKTQIVFLGNPEGVIATQPERLRAVSQSIFTRPVEVYSLLRRVEALIGAAPEGVISGAFQPATRAPVLVAAARKPYMVDASQAHERGKVSQPSAERPPVPSSVPPVEWTANTQWQASGEIRLEGLEQDAQLSLLPEPPRAQQDLNARSPISPELSSLLQEAELRLENKPLRDLHKQRLSPEAEIDAVLPPEVLASLDEPLDDDDFEVDFGPGTKSGSEPGGTSPGTEGGQAPKVDEASEDQQNRATNPGGIAPSSRRQTASNSVPPNDQLPATDPPPTPIEARHTPIPGSLEYQTTTQAGEQRTGAPLTTPPKGSDPDSVEQAALATASDPLPTSRPPRLQHRPSATTPEATHHDLHEERPPSAGDESDKADTDGTGRAPLRDAPVGFPRPLGDGIARSSVARVVRQRLTGAMVFESDEGIRRVVFRDGDFVTAASSVIDESLVAFLAVRGDLSADAASQLKRRLPPFGRHAGAALIANGHLKQDELWNVLRAHAEWLIGRLIQLETGQVDWETDIPERLSSEPAVFGGSTGAEVFLETLRRVATADRSLSHLGGRSVRLSHGAQFDLLSECALSPSEADLVRRIPVLTLSDMEHSGAPQDFATVCLALVELGVLAHASNHDGDRAPPARPPPEDPLDDQALRARVAARYQLVQEGDYFALLGVPRNATSYEIQKAHTNLKAELSPERVLTARNADLQDQLQTILEVVDEAYEILGDQLRRDRYKRALEALPSFH